MAQILIIEDEPSVLNLLRRIVTHMEHEPVVASNGTDALSRLSGMPLDLIISDLRLPGSPSGVELIRQIRQLKPDVPVVVISGYASRDFVSGWTELGVEDFLPKPFDMHMIRDTINRALQRGKQPASPA